MLAVDTGVKFILEDGKTVDASQLKHDYSKDEGGSDSSGSEDSSSSTGDNTTPNPPSQTTKDSGIGSIVSPTANGKYKKGSKILLDIRPTGSAGLGNIKITGTCQIWLGNTIKFSETVSTTGTSGAITYEFTPDTAGKYVMVVDLNYMVNYGMLGLPADTSHHSVVFTVTDPNGGSAKKKGDGNQGQNDGTTIKTSSASYSVTADLKAATFSAPKDKAAKTVTIPATVKVNGKSVPVTSIAPNAFKDMSNLTSVTIGKNVKKIGKDAFNGCKNLKKISIKTTKLTAKTVGANAFKGIYKKAVIKCPKSKKAAYKKILLKKGMQKTMIFK